MSEESKSTHKSVVKPKEKLQVSSGHKQISKDRLLIVLLVTLASLLILSFVLSTVTKPKYAPHLFKNEDFTYSVNAVSGAHEDVSHGSTRLIGVTANKDANATFSAVQSPAPSLQTCAVLGPDWKSAFSFTSKSATQTDACSLKSKTYLAVVSRGSSQYLLTLKSTGKGSVSTSEAKTIFTSFNVVSMRKTGNLKPPASYKTVPLPRN